MPCRHRKKNKRVDSGIAVVHNDITMSTRLLVTLDGVDIAAIQRLMGKWGLPSQASAVRYAVRWAAENPRTEEAGELGKEGVGGGSKGAVETAGGDRGEPAAAGASAGERRSEAVAVRHIEEPGTKKRGGLTDEELMKLPMSERLRRMG